MQGNFAFQRRITVGEDAVTVLHRRSTDTIEIIDADGGKAIIPATLGRGVEGAIFNARFS